MAGAIVIWVLGVISMLLNPFIEEEPKPKICQNITYIDYKDRECVAIPIKNSRYMDGEPDQKMYCNIK